jgi:hypothetical protein
VPLVAAVWQAGELAAGAVPASALNGAADGRGD